MIRPKNLAVIRGEPIELEIAFATDPGSPAPTLTFTLAEERDASTKLLTREVEQVEASPTLFRVLLTTEDTAALSVRTYWYDVWRDDNDQMVAIGSLTVQ